MKQFILFLIVFLLLGASSHAEKIVLFGNAFKAPKIWKEDQLSKGILVDIMTYIGQEMGIDFEIRLYPWKRSYHNAILGRGGIVGISKTEERLKLFDYSESLYDDEVIIVVKKGNEFKYKSNSDLAGKVIGACRGCSFGADFEDAKTYFKLDADDNNISRLRKLLLGRIDGAIMSPGEAALNIEVNKVDDLTREQFSILKKTLDRDPNYLAFEKKLNMKDLIDKFNVALKKAYDSGAIQRIVDKY